MTSIQAILMGIIQGLTEFLPISSSAHLRIFGGFLVKDPGAAFTAIIQLGTETAVLLYFWKDIIRILTKWFKGFRPAATGISQADPDVRMGWMIIVGSLPIGILGLTLQHWIEGSFRNLWITVFMLIVFGIILGWADLTGARKYELSQLTWKDAIIYGFAQALALIPGVSRSGGTITAGRLMGYKRADAARYSFLLAVPAVFASGLYEAAKTVGETNIAGWGNTFIATVVAFIVGYSVIVWFMKLIKKTSFLPFVIYRIGLGILVAIMLLTGLIQAS